MECYACENEATRQCRRCARVYCELHGGDLCAECLNPASALPSFNLYRGSLLALLIGTAIAIWLLVRPTGEGDGSEVAFTFTPSPAVTDVDTGPTRTTPGDATPGARRTATPAGQSTPQQYVVQEGDTLTDIAAQFAPPGVDPFEYAQEIADASGLASVDDPIEPGDTLTLP